MNEPDVEVFEHEGFKCRIQRQGHGGHLCGYVAVGEGHPAYGKDDPAYDVHGGITYSGKSEGLWWIGFDCAHSGDLIPRSPVPGAVYRNWEYVKGQIYKLVEQLKRKQTTPEQLWQFLPEEYNPARALNFVGCLCRFQVTPDAQPVLDTLTGEDKYGFISENREQRFGICDPVPEEQIQKWLDAIRRAGNG